MQITGRILPDKRSVSLFPYFPPHVGLTGLANVSSASDISGGIRGGRGGEANQWRIGGGRSLRSQSASERAVRSERRSWMGAFT